MSLSLPQVVLCSRCPVWPNGSSFLIIYAVCSKSVPSVDYMCPPVVVEPSLILAFHWLGLTLRLTGCEKEILYGG